MFAKYGFAAWVQRGSGLVSTRVMQGLVDRHVDPQIVSMSDGERLRRALTELGTTWVKFGQMLSLRPDVVGDDVAEELEKLQANGRAGSSGCRAGAGRTRAGRRGVRPLRLVRSGADGGGIGRAGAPGDIARRDGGGGEGAPRWRGAPRARGSRAHGSDRGVSRKPGPRDRAAATHGDRFRVLADAPRRNRFVAGAAESPALHRELRR